MGPEEFRAAGHELIDWIADYRARIQAAGASASEPGEVAEAARNAPRKAEPFSAS
jgi:aromatic-L-amino-acid decarboxylase